MSEFVDTSPSAAYSHDSLDSMKNTTMSDSSSRKKGIFILSAARSTSTTLMKIFQQIHEQQTTPSTSAVFLEPFSQPYYVENNLLQTPGIAIQPSIPSTFIDALHRVLSPLSSPNPPSFILAKDLGHQCQRWLEPEFDSQITELLNSFNFLFLIRSPEETILSGYHPYYEIGQGEEFTATDVGFTALKNVFDFIERRTGHPPLVLDAQDYLKDPEGVLPGYFQAMGYEFQPSYLTWNPMSDEEIATNPDFLLWGDTWYGVLRKSSGLSLSRARGITSPASPAAVGGGGVAGKGERYPYSLEDHPQLKAILETEMPSYLDMKRRGAVPSPQKVGGTAVVLTQQQEGQR
jgi:hypothetical protein